MQNASGAVPQPEAILEWLQQEMGYRPQGQYLSSGKAIPSSEDLKKICRGNMLPVWNFLLHRVKSEKTVEKIRRNILVHGSPSIGNVQEGVDAAKNLKESLSVKDEEVKGKSRKRFDGRGKGKSAEVAKSNDVLERAHASEAYETREKALRERDSAEKEVERLRHVLQRQRKELKGRMLEISREESERKRMLDDKSNYRQKQVMLEAYDQRCEETSKIFAEYQRRLHRYVEQARDAQRVRVGGGHDATPDILRARNEQEMVYATVKGNKPADGPILIETAQERSIRKACESLAEHLIERIRNTFPAYDGGGVQGHAQLEAAKLGIELDGEIPDDVKIIALNLLRSPPQLLRAITTHTARVVNQINQETEKIDIRADAERLRYKYENNRIMDAGSPDGNSYSQNRNNGNSRIGTDASSKGTYKQLRERQRAHVQQFMATEDALNKAAEARKASEKLIKRTYGSDNGDVARSTGDGFQNAGGLRQFELEVWSKERELAGLRASVNTLISEVQRLKKMCGEWKEAEDALRKKWKKIEEFDARRTELESVYTALVRANLAAAASWEQHPLAAREYSAHTIIPACTMVQNKATEGHDLIEKEVAAFHRSPDNRLYMLPSTPQALLDSMGASGSMGPEAVAAAEKNAELLTARAGARDPSAIPTICRISAALQYHAGLEGSDAGLASVLESLEFCLKLRGSEAGILEDLSKAINQVHMLQDLVHSGRALLNNAYSSRPEYERTASFCLSMASEQEKIAMEKWLPELKAAVHDAQRCLEDCKRVRGLVDEWWEQPAATAVDWITVDGQNVAAWLAHVKQLQMAFYDKQLL